MSAEEFWHGDPWLAKAYRKAHELKRQADNQRLWLQGFYVYDAFAVVLSNLFGKKGSKKQEYFKKPIDIFGKEKSQEETVEEELRKQDAMIMSLTALANNWKNRQPKE